MKNSLDKKGRNILTGLLILSLAIGILSIVRLGYFGSTSYLFLLWNVFLAWIPFCIAYALWFRNPKKSIGTLGIVLWLCFFPNAPYVISDFIHLLNGGSSSTIWFSMIQVFLAAYTSVLLALFSIYFMKKYAQGKFSPILIRIGVWIAIVLSCFGVYLGRFERVNTWHIISSPLDLLISTKRSLGLIFHQSDSLLFCLLFLIVIGALYLSFHYLFAPNEK